MAKRANGVQELYKEIMDEDIKEDIKKELKEDMWILFNFKMVKKLKGLLTPEEIAEITDLDLKTVLSL